MHDPWSYMSFMAHFNLIAHNFVLFGYRYVRYFNQILAFYNIKSYLCIVLWHAFVLPHRALHVCSGKKS